VNALSKIKFVLEPLVWTLLALLALISLVSCAQATPASLQVGSTAPDFSLPAFDGRTISLADYKGQPVLLYFHMAKG
jgi:cytochrome oxidase Cu insertion factor (SCO1/SenC/PrrC family)